MLVVKVLERVSRFVVVSASSSLGAMTPREADINIAAETVLFCEHTGDVQQEI